MYKFFSTCWKPGVAVLLLALWGSTPAFADGTETLGTPSLTLADGSGIAAAGVGLLTQPGIINITVPVAATIEQVLLYWEGHNFSAAGDNTIIVNGTEVTGTLIGGPTLFFLASGTTPTYSTTFRADITALGAVAPGANAVTVEGLVYDLAANGAGIMVVYDDGTETELFLVDGNDCMYRFFAPPLDASVAQTFTFAAATTDRVAPLSMFFSSVQGLASTGGLLRPSRISVTVGGVTTNYDDILDSNEGEEWDTFTLDVNIPAGETQVIVEAVSGPGGDEDQNTPVEKPASFVWSATGLAVPVPQEQCEGEIGDRIWKDNDCDGNQDANEPGIAGVTVILSDSLGNVLATTTTDADGYYLFTELCSACYKVSVDATTLPPGYTPTTCSNVAGNGINSNCSPAPVILTTNNTQDLTIDFGYCPPPPCVSGTFSFAGNTSTSGTHGNIRTFTTNGVSVKVSAFSRFKNAATWETSYLGLYSYGLGVTDKYEGSGANGTHRVDNIDKNNYVLFEFSTPVVLTRAFLDAIVTDSDISIWFGTLTDPFNNHTTLNDAVLSGMLTEQDETASSNARWASFNSGQIFANILVIAADISDTTPEDQFKINKLEFGCVPNPPPQCSGKIGDRVWKDKDCDGCQDSNESGIAGVKVYLLNGNTNAVLDSTITDANGYYYFKNLCAGCYKIKVDTSTLPTGYKATTCSNSSTSGTNSNCSPATVVLGSNSSTNLTIDFGYCPPPPCVPVTFTFCGSTSTCGTAGNIRTFTVNGISVKVSAFSRLKTSATWDKAYLGLYSYGFGVTDKYEGDGGSNKHRVDNIDKNNYVLFEFSTPVTITKAYLDAVLTDSDISVWYGTFASPYTNHLNLSDAVLGGMVTEQNTTTSSSARWATFNGGKVTANVLVIAADVMDTNPEDWFKIRKIEIVCPTGPSGAANSEMPSDETSDEVTPEITPSTYQLKQNYPNPFNPTTEIYFELPEAGTTSLKIYNALGQEIKTLVNGDLDAGMHAAQWDATDDNGRHVSSGVYFYVLRSNDFTSMKKMSLLK